MQYVKALLVADLIRDRCGSNLSGIISLAILALAIKIIFLCIQSRHSQFRDLASHARLSSTLWKRAYFYFRSVEGQALSGTIPLKISLLTALQDLYALHNRRCLLASLMEVECWSCAPSLSFSTGLSFYLQEPRVQPIGWDNPSSNICPGQAEIPVSLHFFFI